MRKQDFVKYKIGSWNTFSTWEKLNSINFDTKKENPQPMRKSR